MSRCDLYLENYQNQYVSGDTIIGQVICTFQDAKEVNSIYVRIKGEGSTHWTDTESHYDAQQKKNVSRTVHYHGSEIFLQQQVDVLPHRGSAATIPAGVHKYPFTFNLPSTLPSTFSGKYGKIVYNIKAVVERPFLKFNYDAESDIVIYSPVNLNNDPSLRNPVQLAKEKHPSILCWNKGTISVEVKLPHKAFALGHPVPIHISVENLAQINVEFVKCKIKRIVEFIAHTPKRDKKHTTDEIFNECYSGVGAHGANTYDKEITIPESAICPNLANCHLITVGYELKVMFELPCPHRNLVILIPISVGNIPLMGHVGGPVSPVMANQVATAPPAYSSLPEGPKYGFVPPQQPAFNPAVVPLPGQMPYPPMQMPMLPSTSMPMPMPVSSTNGLDDEVNVDGFVEITPEGAPSAPSGSTWSNNTNQDLPTYDQAMNFRKH